MHVLSVRKNDWLIGELSSRWHILSNFVATTAANNSIRGIVTGLIGASLALPITSKHFTLWLLSWTLRYDTAPYPCCDASAKWWSWTFSTSPRNYGLKHCSITSCSSLGSSCSQACHRFNDSSGIGSSQSNFLRHKSCRMSLAWNINGAANPRGS